MRFDIRYGTRFTYEAPVIESHNELRACPVTDEHQRLVTYRVGVILRMRAPPLVDGRGGGGGGPGGGPPPRGPAPQDRRG